MSVERKYLIDSTEAVLIRRGKPRVTRPPKNKENHSGIELKAGKKIAKNHGIDQAQNPRRPLR